MNELMISDVAIRQDADNRYCLNDLHKAAISTGANARTKEPAKFLSSGQVLELISELTDAQNLGIAPVSAIRGGQGQGTYVCKELVYAYAMWISPAFNLKVIRAYDGMAMRPQIDPMQVLQDPAAMRGLLLTYSEKVLSLEAENEAMKPKVAALDRIATPSDGSYCIREAAKMLQVREKQLYQFLNERKWIYRHPMGKSWLAHAPTLRKGYMEHKHTEGDKEDGSRWTSTQARITSAGLARLSMLLTQEQFNAEEMLV